MDLIDTAASLPPIRWDVIRGEYESRQFIPPVICKRHGITLAQLRYRREAEGWLSARARIVRKEDLVARMLKVLDKQVRRLEMAVDEPIDKQANVLSTHIKSLDKLIELGAAQANVEPATKKDVTDDATGATVLNLERRGLLGVTATALQPGPIGVWDRAHLLEVSLYAGHLASVEPLAVLAGSNRIAVETDNGGWEVIGFAEATLLTPGRYRLAGLLRGLDGTAPAMGAISAARRIMVLDQRVASLPVEPGRLGETRTLRVYAGSSDLDGTVVEATNSVAAALPLPPVHLRAGRITGGDIAFSWKRCSRADGEGWGAVESPLEHVPERYRLTVFNGSSAVRTFDCAATAASYSSAEQTADFGSLPASFGFTVAQISPVLGAGHAASGEFNG